MFIEICISFFMIKYSKFTDNIGSGSFVETFCQNTNKCQKIGGGGVTPPQPPLAMPLPVKYSYLSIFPDYNADIFAASLLISYCNFSSLILPSVVIISFYVLPKRFFLKRKRLSDARIVSITNK